MKQNWWKLLVVVVLVVAVGVALAAKNRSSDNTALVATETSEAPVTESVDAAEPAEDPLVAEETQAEPVVETVGAEPAKKDVPAQVAKAETAAPAAESKKPADTQAAAQSKPVATQLPKMIELGADKCIPCKMMQPIIDELRKDYKGTLEIDFIDVWKDSSAAEKWNIQSIPTQVFLDEKGKEFFRHTGFFPKDDILKVFKDHGINLE